MMLQEINRISALLGQDPLIIQGGGGNISLKDPTSNSIWVKASGKWLKYANTENIYVELDLKKGQAWLESRETKFPENWSKSIHPLRPSIETSLHLLFGQKVVIHSHPVSILSQSAQSNGEELLKQQLTGLIWAYLPYVMPGNDLANAISEHPLFGQCEIFILKNHGLITCGKDAETAYTLTLDVLKRCQTPVRPFAETNFSLANSADNSKQFSNDYYWAKHQQIHSLVLDPISLSFFDQDNNVLYPDQAVFLGKNALFIDTPNQITSGVSLPFLLIRNQGVLIHKNASPMVEQMLACHAEILARIPVGVPLNYLSDYQVSQLSNWDAEKYRESINR